MMATLHLSLYGNLEHAAPFAAKSDRKDLKALADAVKANPPRNLSDDPAKHALQVLAIAEALVDVAKATNPAQLFDRYSIACYAGDHVAQMLADSAVPEERIPEAKAVLQAAREIVDKTNLRRGDDLPRWLDGASPTASGKPAASKPIATLADVLQLIPRDLMPPDMAWDGALVAALNDWLSKNLVGQTFDGTALFDRVDSPADSGGKVYVPVLFGLRNPEVKDTTTIRMTIENRMTVSLAARAKKLRYEQETPIKGTITGITVYAAGKAVRFHLVMDNKSD
jgi:DNA-directed RNA polymerase subunit K/omega